MFTPEPPIRNTKAAPALLLFALLLAVGLAGCTLNGKPGTKAAVTSPPPPAVTAPPPQPPPPQPEPLSIRQTQVELPTPQPISPEALATTQAPEQPAEVPAGPRPSRRPPTPGQAAAPPRPEPAPAQPPAAAAPADDRGTAQEIIPANELRRLQESVAARRAEVRRTLDVANARSLNRDQRAQVERIQGFLQQADEYEKRGDMRLADNIALRAQALARELQNGLR